MPVNNPSPSEGSGEALDPRERLAKALAAREEASKAPAAREGATEVLALREQAAKVVASRERVAHVAIGVFMVTVMCIVVAPFILLAKACDDFGSIFSHDPEELRSQPSATTNTSSIEKPWYSGGTLHHSKMTAWSRATYRNRLATAGDLAGKMLEIDGIAVTSTEQIKPYAVMLERRISAAAETGLTENDTVSTIAILCWIEVGKQR